MTDDYDPVKSLRAEVDRFKSTNTYNPLTVTHLYVQAGAVLRELSKARQKIDDLRAIANVNGDATAKISRLQSELAAAQNDITATAKVLHGHSVEPSMTTPLANKAAQVVAELAQAREEAERQTAELSRVITVLGIEGEDDPAEEILAIKKEARQQRDRAESLGRSLDNAARLNAELRAQVETRLGTLRDCDAVARKRGDKHGLCDAIDNDGQPYQSQWLAGLLTAPAAEAQPISDASLMAQVGGIGNELHNLGCERQNDEALAERLDELRDRLWNLAKRCPAEAQGVPEGLKLVPEQPTEREISDGLLAYQEVLDSSKRADEGVFRKAMRAARQAMLAAPAAEAQGEPRTPELWCLHVIGPDDVHPAPSKAHAEKAAEMFNERFGPVAERTGVMVKAVVAPWPHSPEAHAEGVGSFTADWMAPQVAEAQGVLDGAYRPLLRGEIMQEGDEYLNDDYSAWEVLRRPMFGPGKPWSDALKPMRRKIAAAPAKGEEPDDEDDEVNVVDFGDDEPPRCRDCADFGPICPNSGKPCDPDTPAKGEE